jgi:hypothetical protein
MLCAAATWQVPDSKTAVSCQHHEVPRLVHAYYQSECHACMLYWAATQPDHKHSAWGSYTASSGQAKLTAGNMMMRHLPARNKDSWS